MRAPVLLTLSVVLAAAPTRALAEEPSGGLSKLPVLVEKAEAIYPPPALEARVAGAVVLELDIDATGAVEDVTVVRSSTAAEAGRAPAAAPGATGTSTVSAGVSWGFVDAARAAAYQLVFEPAEENGVPVPVRITYTFRFELPPLPEPLAAAGSSTTAPPLPRAPGKPNLVGVARERGTRALLSGAVVTVFRGTGAETVGFEATTGPEGEFQLVDLEPGDWNVLVELEGYFPFRTRETIEPGIALDVTYYLERGSANPFDVLVEAQRPKKEVNRRTLSVAEIVKVPGTLGDPILVVENLPGVARVAGGQIVVRGSGPEDTDVYIDGITVPLIYHFGALRSVVPAEMIETVDFYPGNYSVYYGKALGGVFDARLKRIAPDQLHGSLDVSLLDASLFLELPITDNLYVAVAGRRSYIDFILNAVLPDDGAVSLTSAPRYYDYQALVRWQPSDRHDVRASFIGSDDTLEILFNNPGDLDVRLRARDLSAETRFWRAIGEHEWRIGDGLDNLLRIAAGNDVISSSLGEQFRFNLDITQLQLREALTFKASDRLTITGGVDLEYNVTDVSIRSPLPPKEGGGQMMPDIEDVRVAELNDVAQLTAAPYLEAIIQVTEALSFSPGLRLDWYSQVEELGFDPRIVARYRVNEEWTAKAGVGLVHQEPTPDETADNFGNPDLGLETAIQYSLGAEWKPLAYLGVDLTFFYKDMMDLVSRTGQFVERNGVQEPLIYDNNGTGRVYGLELYAKHDLANNLTGWLTYTLSRAERTDSGVSGSRLFDYDQTHILTLVASYRFPENWELGIRWRIISGNPTTPIVGSVFVSDNDQYEPVRGTVNSSRLPLFNQLDIRLDKRWIFDAWILSAYLSLTNAYNNPAVDAFQYNYDYSESQPQEGLPIYPILGIRGEF